jgi:hypothetical protein
VVIGRIGPKHIEAIPARIGFQFDGSSAFDPALTGHCVMQQMRGIDKVDFPVAF